MQIELNLTECIELIKMCFIGSSFFICEGKTVNVQVDVQGSRPT